MWTKTHCEENTMSVSSRRLFIIMLHWGLAGVIVSPVSGMPGVNNNNGRAPNRNPNALHADRSFDASLSRYRNNLNRQLDLAGNPANNELRDRLSIFGNRNQNFNALAPDTRPVFNNANNNNNNDRIARSSISEKDLTPFSELLASLDKPIANNVTTDNAFQGSSNNIGSSAASPQGGVDHPFSGLLASLGQPSTNTTTKNNNSNNVFNDNLNLATDPNSNPNLPIKGLLHSFGEPANKNKNINNNNDLTRLTRQQSNGKAFGGLLESLGHHGNIYNSNTTAGTTTNNKKPFSRFLQQPPHNYNGINNVNVMTEGNVLPEGDLEKHYNNGLMARLEQPNDNGNFGQSQHQQANTDNAFSGFQAPLPRPNNFNANNNNNNNFGQFANPQTKAGTSFKGFQTPVSQPNSHNYRQNTEYQPSSNYNGNNYNNNFGRTADHQNSNANGFNGLPPPSSQSNVYNSNNFGHNPGPQTNTTGAFNGPVLQPNNDKGNYYNNNKNNNFGRAANHQSYNANGFNGLPPPLSPPYSAKTNNTYGRFADPQTTAGNTFNGLQGSVPRPNNHYANNGLPFNGSPKPGSQPSGFNANNDNQIRGKLPNPYTPTGNTFNGLPSVPHPNSYYANPGGLPFSGLPQPASQPNNTDANNNNFQATAGSKPNTANALDGLPTHLAQPNGSTTTATSNNNDGRFTGHQSNTDNPFNGSPPGAQPYNYYANTGLPFRGLPRAVSQPNHFKANSNNDDSDNTEPTADSKPNNANAFSGVPAPLAHPSNPKTNPSNNEGRFGRFTKPRADTGNAFSGSRPPGSKPNTYSANNYNNLGHTAYPRNNSDYLGLPPYRPQPHNTHPNNYNNNNFGPAADPRRNGPNAFSRTPPQPHQPNSFNANNKNNFGHPGNSQSNVPSGFNELPPPGSQPTFSNNNYNANRFGPGAVPRRNTPNAFRRIPPQFHQPNNFNANHKNNFGQPANYRRNAPNAFSGLPPPGSQPTYFNNNHNAKTDNSIQGGNNDNNNSNYNTGQGSNPLNRNGSPGESRRSLAPPSNYNANNYNPRTHYNPNGYIPNVYTAHDYNPSTDFAHSAAAQRRNAGNPYNGLGGASAVQSSTNSYPGNIASSNQRGNNYNNLGRGGGRPGVDPVNKFQASLAHRNEVHATCNIKPDPEAPYIVTGTVDFKQGLTSLNFPMDQLKIRGQLAGFPSNDRTLRHGLHVHEYGDLRGGCGSTGPHFNPLKSIHGARNSPVRHVGDFGNIEEDGQGRVIIGFEDKLASLSGDNSIIGRALVIHENPDDLGQGGDQASLENGNSGRRVACCVIGFAAPTN